MSGIIHFFHALGSSSHVMVDATVLTLKLTIVSILIAVIIGLLFSLMKVSRITPLEKIADLYIWLVRGTPLIVQIFVLFIGLTSIVKLSAFWAATGALAFHNGAYIAEIIRGSIQSIDKGQMEAGRSLGMSQSLTMRRIILPQAFRRAVPPLGNQFIIGLKDSSLASFIGLQELFGVSNTLGSNNFAFMVYYLIVAIYYLILVGIFTVLVNMLEKKLATSDK